MRDVVDLLDVIVGNIGAGIRRRPGNITIEADRDGG
jgi:hypothetical protein